MRVGTGYVYDKHNADGNEVLFRLRADEPHNGAEYNHLNLETIYKGEKKKPILDNLHEKFDWKEQK